MGLNEIFAKASQEFRAAGPDRRSHQIPSNRAEMMKQARAARTAPSEESAPATGSLDKVTTGDEQCEALRETRNDTATNSAQKPTDERTDQQVGREIAQRVVDGMNKRPANKQVNA